MPSSCARLAQSTDACVFPVVFVAAHERQRVAAAGIGRSGCRRSWAPRCRPECRAPPRTARPVREGTALRPAAIEHERIAPLQPRHRLALARLLREQVADRFLFERLRRGEADVDLFGVRARVRSSRAGTM